MAKKKEPSKLDVTAPIGDPVVESGPEKVEDVASKVSVKPESHDSDIAKHPKFAKFNSNGGK